MCRTCQWLLKSDGDLAGKEIGSVRRKSLGGDESHLRF